MTKSKEVTSALREETIGLLRGNHSLLQISRILGLPKSTVQYIVKRWKKNEETNNIPRSGRPKKISDRGLRKLKRVVKGNRMSTLKRITSEFNEGNTVVSQTTVRRRLKELGYQARMPSRKPLISEANRRKRLAFYNLYKSWTLIDWKKVIWSDESRFNLYNSDGKTRM